MENLILLLSEFSILINQIIFSVCNGLYFLEPKKKFIKKKPNRLIVENYF